jgi:hypothetical protein
VTVDDDGIPAKRGPTALDCGHVVPELRSLTLAEPVHVNDRAEIVEFEMLPEVCGLPNRSFGHFAVAKQYVRTVVRLDSTGIESDADTRADSLTQRTCRE